MTVFHKVSAVFNIIFALAALVSTIFVLVLGFAAIETLGLENPGWDGVGAALAVALAIIIGACQTVVSLICAPWSFVLGFTARAPEGKGAVVFKTTFFSSIATFIISAAMIVSLIFLF